MEYFCTKCTTSGGLAKSSWGVPTLLPSHSRSKPPRGSKRQEVIRSILGWTRRLQGSRRFSSSSVIRRAPKKTMADAAQLSTTARALLQESSASLHDTPEGISFRLAGPVNARYVEAGIPVRFGTVVVAVSLPGPRMLSLLRELELGAERIARRSGTSHISWSSWRVTSKRLRPPSTLRDNSLAPAPWPRWCER